MNLDAIQEINGQLLIISIDTSTESEYEPYFRIRKFQDLSSNTVEAEFTIEGFSEIVLSSETSTVSGTLDVYTDTEDTSNDYLAACVSIYDSSSLSETVLIMSIDSS